MVVNDYLEAQFGPIIDYNFTANVEKEFDRIAEGDITWEKMIGNFYGPFHKMVDSAIAMQPARTREVRILGNDPATGHVVKARIGRYGPMVEIEGAEGEKGRFASLRKGQLIESITLDEALELFALPRDLGLLDGEKAHRGTGQVRTLRPLRKVVRLAGADRRPLHDHLRAGRGARPGAQGGRRCGPYAAPTFPEDPDMLVKNGRYGAYIAYKGKNYRLPRGTKPETLTLDDCLKIVSESKK